jgi:hypothetical protein
MIQLAILMMAGQIADILTTEYGLIRGHSELNPIAKRLMKVSRKFAYVVKLIISGSNVKMMVTTRRQYAIR